MRLAVSENEFEFTPMAKIWLTTNHEPVICGTDDGIWRRIWKVPFAVLIPEDKCDPDIAAKLLTESAGILNWCLAGLKRFFENGGRLVQPRKVSVATGNLRTVSDTVGLFLATECVVESGSRISRMAMNEVFERWCEEEGYKQHISKKKLFGALREMGVTDGGKSGIDRYWSGLRFKNEQERIAAEQAVSGQVTLGVIMNIFKIQKVWTPWTPFPVFPESPTRKLYRKKIPEFVKMVSMVPGAAGTGIMNE